MTDGWPLSTTTMERRHIQAIRRLDKKVYARPWSASLYRDELRNRDRRVYRVALRGQELVGYAGVMLVADEGHVTSVAVDPEVQGAGIATRLLLEVTRAAIDKGATAMTLEVRASNRRAQDLYRRFGYVPAGIRKAYYPDNREDALVMWCHDLQLPGQRSRLDELERSLTERHGVAMGSGATGRDV